MGCSKHGDKPSGFVKCRGYCDWLRNSASEEGNLLHRDKVTLPVLLHCVIYVNSKLSFVISYYSNESVMQKVCMCMCTCNWCVCVCVYVCVWRGLCSHEQCIFISVRATTVLRLI